MERYLLNSEDFRQHYTCNYSLDKVPLENRQNILLGVFFFTIGFVETILYIPCLIAISKHLRSSSYKFMFVMGLLDIPALLISAIITALFGGMGEVYCSAPNLIYIVGAFGFALWILESTVEIILAINRCIVLCCSRPVRMMLFKGRRTWFWIIPPICYGLYVFVFEKPILFSGIYFSWLFNAHVGYQPINKEALDYYRSNLHTVHNYLVMITLTGTYCIIAYQIGAFHQFIRLFRFCTKNPIMLTETALSGNKSRKTRIVSQVILISMINTAAAYIFVYVQHCESSEFLNALAQFLWSQAHGIPPFIYLLLNRTLRTDCLKMLSNAIKSFRCSVAVSS